MLYLTDKRFKEDIWRGKICRKVKFEKPRQLKLGDNREEIQYVRDFI